MSKAYDEGRYLARTLAVTLLDLVPAERNEILCYLQQELERLVHAPGEDVSGVASGEAEIASWMAERATA